MERKGTEISRLLQLFDNKIVREITFSKKEIIIKSDKIAKGIYLIDSGIVKQVMFKKGSSYTVGYDSSGSLQGTEIIFNMPSPFSVMALTKVSARFIPAEYLKHRINNDLLNTDLLTWLCRERIKKLTEKLLYTQSLDASQQIALAILEISNLNGQDHTGNISRKELANFACCSVEYAFRTLASWQKRGIISISGKNILIKNRKVLGTMVE